MSTKFCSTKSELVDMLTAIEVASSSRSPVLYIDLEGQSLNRNGTISILTLLLSGSPNVTYLVDITTMKQQAFSIKSPRGLSLRNVLESPTIKKVVFDVRNDSDALFAHYNISLKTVEDLQLMELATRSGNKKFLNGLAKSITNDAGLTYAARTAWTRVKDRGAALFDPSKGGTYEVFDARPLSQEIVDYCVQDVTYMPLLRDKYRSKISNAWQAKVDAESVERVKESQQYGYVPNGLHKAIPPKSFLR